MATELVTTTDLGALNARRLADAIVSSGAISRAQLARDTGLSKPTVSIALARLESAGLVREVGRTQGGRGATALLYDLAPDVGMLARPRRRPALGAVPDLRPGRSRAGHHRRSRPRAPARRRSATSSVDLVAATLARGRARRGPAGRRHPGRPRCPGARRATGSGWRPGCRACRARRSWPGCTERSASTIHVENDVNLAATAELALGRGRQSTGLRLPLGGHRGRAWRSCSTAGCVPAQPDPRARSATCRSPRRAVRRPAAPYGPASRGRSRPGSPPTAWSAEPGPAGSTSAPRRRSSRPARGRRRRARSTPSPSRPTCSPRASPPSAPSSTRAWSSSAAVSGSAAADLLLPLLHKALRRLTPLRPTVVASELGDHAVLDGAVVDAVATAQETVLGTITGHHRGRVAAAQEAP